MSTSDVVVLRVARRDWLDGDVARSDWLASVLVAPDFFLPFVPRPVFPSACLVLLFLSAGVRLGSSAASLPAVQAPLYQLQPASFFFSPPHIGVVSTPNFILVAPDFPTALFFVRLSFRLFLLLLCCFLPASFSLFVHTLRLFPLAFTLSFPCICFLPRATDGHTVRDSELMRLPLGSMLHRTVLSPLSISHPSSASLFRKPSSSLPLSSYFLQKGSIFLLKGFVLSSPA